jgi:hypothetical protein
LQELADCVTIWISSASLHCSYVEGDRRYLAEDGQVTVLLLLDSSPTFDMAVLLCKLRNAQKYSVGAGMLVGSYLSERAQFVRSGGQESSVWAVTCGVPHMFLLLVGSCLYHILKMSRGLSGIAVFTFMRMICRFITLVLCRTFKCVLMS